MKIPDNTILAAIIGAVATIFAALIAFLATRRSSSSDEKRDSKSAQIAAENVKVLTSGDNSPGIVFGNYTINQQVVQRYEKVRRSKRWRPLSIARWPVPHGFDRGKAATLITSNMAAAAYQTLLHSGYVEFTTVLIAPNSSNSGKIDDYVIISHKAGFCGTIEKNHFALLKLLKLLPQQRKEYEAEKARISREWEESPFRAWAVTRSLDDKQIQALTVRFNPEFHEVDIAPPKNVSANIADYPQHLATTSELLQWIAIALESPVVFAGNAGWLNENPALMKLMIDLLDKKAFEWDKVQVNIADDEEWDYLSPQLEAEMKGFT